MIGRKTGGAGGGEIMFNVVDNEAVSGGHRLCFLRESLVAGFVFRTDIVSEKCLRKNVQKGMLLVERFHLGARHIGIAVGFQTDPLDAGGEFNHSFVGYVKNHNIEEVKTNG